MKQDIKEPWVDALLSGKYEQAKGRLRESNGGGKESYCCLGVLACVMKKDWNIEDDSGEDNGSWRSDESLSSIFRDEVGLTQAQHDALAELNDAGVSFGHIAQVIKAFA